MIHLPCIDSVCDFFIIGRFGGLCKGGAVFVLFFGRCGMHGHTAEELPALCGTDSSSAISGDAHLRFSFVTKSTPGASVHPQAQVAQGIRGRRCSWAACPWGAARRYASPSPHRRWSGGAQVAALGTLVELYALHVASVEWVGVALPVSRASVERPRTQHRDGRSDAAGWPAPLLPQLKIQVWF